VDSHKIQEVNLVKVDFVEECGEAVVHAESNKESGLFQSKLHFKLIWWKISGEWLILGRQLISVILNMDI
jgi:hypothetical protein